MRESNAMPKANHGTTEEHLGFASRNLETSARTTAPEVSDSSYPYDAWVLAGGTLFRAHAHVLGAHSPYLRASINALGEARLLLPHIPPAGFGTILSYMYTGRLSLTQAPLYETLLTGHLLQMPAIVALCQTLLASSPPLVLTQTEHDFGRMANTRLPQAERTLPEALTPWQNLARLAPATTALQQTLIRPTPTRPGRSQPIALPHPGSSSQDSADVGWVTSEGDSTARCHLLREDYEVCSLNTRGVSASPEIAQPDENSASISPVVLDVAACDGPVVFERVINKAFNSQANNHENTSDSDDSEINVVDTEMVESPLLRGFTTSFKNQIHAPIPHPGGGARIYHCVYCNSNFKSHYCYQKHMRRHINPITVEETEAATDMTPAASRKENGRNASKGGEAMVAQSPSEMHSGTGAKDELSEAPSPSPSTTKDNESKTESVSSGEELKSNPVDGGKLRVLDLNVQYFPCKTCGSKFPSYYFVHKHRRMCHREEEETGVRRKSQTPTTSTSSSSCESLAFTSNNIRTDLQPNSLDGSSESILK